MPVLEDAPRASFDKIEFPFTARTARGEFRHHVHEFPKMAGGQPEKLGRKVWSFSFDCPFHATDLYFPDLYPKALDALTDRFARGVTAELVIPEMGILRAFITKFERRRRGATLSGEEAQIEFLEDDLENFRRAQAPEARATMVEAAQLIQGLMNPAVPPSDAAEAQIERYRKPMGSLLDLVNSVLAIRDQVELYGARVGAQLAGIARSCRELHELIKGPDLWPLREGLRDLWDATREIQQDVMGKGPGSSLATYVTPAVMSVGQIAQALYSDASRGPEILALNSNLDDPFAVDAGLTLVVYSS